MPPQTAYNDFEVVAAANLLDGKQCKVSDCILGYALYIDPQLGRLGRVEPGDRIRLRARAER